MESIQNFFNNVWAKFKAWIDANPRRAGLWAGAIILFIVGLFIPVAPPHVSLSGEPIFSDGPDWLTNSLITTIVVDVIVILLAVLATARMSVVPSGLQNLMEMLVEALYNLSESVAGHRARDFFPYCATIFIFVLICNYSGLIPGVGSIGFYHLEEHAEEGTGEHAQKVDMNLDAQLAMAEGNLVLVEPVGGELLAQAETPEDEAEEHAEEEEGAVGESAEEEHGPKFVPLFRAPSADLNLTFALAIATVVMVQVWGVRSQGGAYFSKFSNFSGPNIAMKLINGFVSILEIISEFARILAFGFRLFGNIFAGEVVLAVMAFLVPFLLPLPFYALEVGVGAIQAFVFMMLALVFFTMATIAHGHEQHHDEPAVAAEAHEVDVDTAPPGTLAPGATV
jgi:F-type H+-transporting ATPase subunit a